MKIFRFANFLCSHFFIPDLDYTTYADVVIDNRGYRRLLYNGFRFGIHYDKKGETTWRCTTYVYKKGTGKRTGCRARIKSKMVNGYEMIKDPNVQHDH